MTAATRVQTNNLDLVRATAIELNLIEKDELTILDSMGIVELTMLLEKKTGIRVPRDRLDRTAFRSLQSVASLFDELALK